MKHPNDELIKLMFLKSKLAIPTPDELDAFPVAFRTTPVRDKYDRINLSLHISKWLRTGDDNFQPCTPVTP
jgi:hypothetical protein